MSRLKEAVQVGSIMAFVIAVVMLIWVLLLQQL